MVGSIHGFLLYLYSGMVACTATSYFNFGPRNHVPGRPQLLSQSACANSGLIELVSPGETVDEQEKNVVFQDMKFTAVLNIESTTIPPTPPAPSIVDVTSALVITTPVDKVANVRMLGKKVVIGINEKQLRSLIEKAGSISGTSIDMAATNIIVNITGLNRREACEDDDSCDRVDGCCSQTLCIRPILYDLFITKVRKGCIVKKPSDGTTDVDGTFSTTASTDMTELSISYPVGLNTNEISSFYITIHAIEQAVSVDDYAVSETVTGSMIKFCGSVNGALTIAYPTGYIKREVSDDCECVSLGEYNQLRLACAVNKNRVCDIGSEELGKVSKSILINRGLKRISKWMKCGDDERMVHRKPEKCFDAYFFESCNLIKVLCPGREETYRPEYDLLCARVADASKQIKQCFMSVWNVIVNVALELSGAESICSGHVRQIVSSIRACISLKTMTSICVPGEPRTKALCDLYGIEYDGEYNKILSSVLGEMEIGGVYEGEGVAGATVTEEELRKAAEKAKKVAPKKKEIPAIQKKKGMSRLMIGGIAVVSVAVVIVVVWAVLL